VPLRAMILAGAGVAVILAGAIGFVFQDNITRFMLNPRIPYQIYEAPPPPAYGARGAWAVWPEDRQSGKADIFYLHSTTYYSDDHWNAPLIDEQADEVLRRVAAPNEAGPFMRVGAVYGPRYRQATLFTAFTHKFDGLAARQLAYKDVAAAFEHFLANRDQDRPLIIVGYEQGGLYALGLLQDYINADKQLRAHLIAAYIIGTAVPLSIFDDRLKNIPPCETPDQTGCVIAYIDIEPGLEDEKRRLKRRSLIWGADKELISLTAEPLLCINPLSWTNTNKRINAEHHLGAASATGLRLDETPPKITRAIGAQCVGGILAVDQPQQLFLRRQKSFGGKWRAQDYNLFYHDLAADAVRRLDVLEVKPQAANSHHRGKKV